VLCWSFIDTAPPLCSNHQPPPAIMVATQAALDELDDETLELIISLQLEDAATLEADADTNDPSSVDATVSTIYANELRQYCAIRQFENEETRLAEASAAAVSTVECTSCEDSYPLAEVWQAPCSHHYCSGCLEQLHRASMTDESLYPPRCCRREMPWEDVSAKISNRLAEAFEAKERRTRHARQSADLLFQCGLREVHWGDAHCEGH
jgi:hypothetical protein